MDSLFILNGIVTKGKNRGKRMGFPTANFPADPSIPQGTYISRASLRGKIYPSITFIGTVDTFDEKDFMAETYILGLDEDIYKEEITVFVLKKIRDNMKFESEQALIEQMGKDKKITEEYFGIANPK